MIRQIAFAALAVTLAACAQDANGPTATRVASRPDVQQSVQQFYIDDTEIAPVPRNCTGEPVQWHIREQGTLREMTDAQGNFHGTFDFHDMGSSGVGLVTGLKYIYAANQNEEVNIGADGLPYEDTALFRRIFVSQGDMPNFRVHNLFHFTIDANGELTSYTDTVNRICD